MSLIRTLAIGIVMDESNKSETQVEIQEQKNEVDKIIDSSEQNENQNEKQDENHEVITITGELLLKHWFLINYQGKIDADSCNFNW